MANPTDPNPGRGEIRFLLFSALLRAGSLNTRLVQVAARTIEQHGGTVDLVELREFDCPSFDQDVQETEGLP
jgi:chromate reductase, NAD(P)H dehydrogenase (quinone)